MAADFSPPLTPIIDTVTGSVTEIGRIFLRRLGEAVGALPPVGAQYWLSTSDPTLTNERNLGALASGYLKLAVALGIATPSTVATIPQADVTGLVAALAAKATLPIAEADVTSLVADLALKAPLASPALTGVPSVPTAAPGTNTTQAASTAFVLANAAASVVMFPFQTAVVFAQNQTIFMGPSTASATEYQAQFPVTAALTLTKLYAHTGVAVGGAGQTVTFTVRKNGVDTALTCSIASGATAANDTAHSATFAAGDLLDVKVVLSATTGNVQAFAGVGT